MTQDIYSVEITQNVVHLFHNSADHVMNSWVSG